MMRIAMVLAAGVLASAARAAEEPAPADLPLALAANERVQRELKLNEAQAATVKDLRARVRKGLTEAPAAQKALANALLPEQRQRLRQLGYQVRGGAALIDPAVAKALGLSTKQRDEVRDVWVNEEKTLAMLLKVARFRTAEIRAGFIRNHRKKAGEKMLGSLTEAQQKQFRKMQGEPFDTAGLDVE
jgi:hypothetical protein